MASSAQSLSLPPSDPAPPAGSIYKSMGRLTPQLQTLPAKNGIVPVDSIVAIVNIDLITRSELNQQLRLIRRQLEKQNVPLPAADQLERQVLERLIIDHAQLQLAKESGLRIEDAQIEKTISRIAQQNAMSQEEFRQKLADEGINVNRFRSELRDEMLLTRLREREVDSKVQVSESEIDDFITQQKAGGGSSQEWNLGQILIRTSENAAPTVTDEARRKAEALLAQVRQGADFARLAAANSAAPEALKGGELGLRPAERLPQLFVDAVQALEPGQAVLVKSPNGFHILKVLAKKNASGLTNRPVTQTHARHILIRPSEILPEVEARRRLNIVRERLENQASSFADMARQYSSDSTAQKGGDLGWLYPGDTVPEFERAMDALPSGQISPIVESQYGLHIIQVIERRTTTPSIERQRQAIRLAIRERKAEEAFQDWLRQLRDRTYVEIRLDGS
ncbi:MAG: peptidylprolyl isomerase [Burkholderiaceae bacterium]